MTRHLHPITAIAVGLLCSAAVFSEGLVLEKTEIDFGDVKSSDTPEKELLLTNQSNKPISITRANSSCGCTHASVVETKLGPGQSTKVGIKLHLDDYSSNKVYSNVWIDAEDNDTARPQVTVHAKVLPEYVVTPETVDFGRIKRNAQQSATVRIAHQYGPPLKILKVELPESLVGALKENEPRTLKPSSHYEFPIQLAPDQQAGPFNTRIAVITDSKRIPRIEIPVHAELVGVECNIHPKVLVFGPASPGAELGTLTVEGVNALQINGVTVADKDIVATIKEVEPNKKYEVSLRANKSAANGKKAGKIQIQVKEGDLTETREVAYYGTIGNS